MYYIQEMLNFGESSIKMLKIYLVGFNHINLIESEIPVGTLTKQNPTKPKWLCSIR